MSNIGLTFGTVAGEAIKDVIISNGLSPIIRASAPVVAIAGKEVVKAAVVGLLGLIFRR